MNKKLALLIGIMAFFMIKMSAQDYKYGIYVGGGLNTMNLSSDMYYDDSEVITKTVVHGADTSYTAHYMPIENADVKPMASFSLGAYYEMPMSEIVWLQMHLHYNRYGYRISGIVNQPNYNDNSSVEYKYNGTLKMSNISASILLKFNVLQEKLSIEAGVTPSYCILMSKDVERGPLHKTLSYNSKDDYKAFNICGTIGFTYYYDAIFVSLKANIGIMDVLKVKEPYILPEDKYTILYRYTETKSKTNSVYATVGYRF